MTKSTPAIQCSECFLYSSKQGGLQKIVNCVMDFIEKIRSAISSLYGEGGAMHDEAVLMGEYADELQEIFDRVLSETLEISSSTVDRSVQSSANKKAATDGGKVQYSKDTKGQNYENEQYAEYDKPIMLDDIKLLRSIIAAHNGERVSINEFTSEDIQKAQKWAYKFYKELGVKSPFFRAWFGDWREHSIDPAETVSFAYGESPKINYNKRIIKNADMNKSIIVDDSVVRDSLSYASKHGDKKHIEKILGKVDEILQKGVLLDTKVTADKKGNKKGSTQFMHYLYTPISINGAPFLAKLTIEEYDVDGKTRAYNLRRIEMPKLSRTQFSSLIAGNRGKLAYNSDALSVAQLYGFVKEYDKEFKPKTVHESMIEDGKPKIFYHGTNAEFTEFDRHKARYGLYGKGFYFTDSESNAKNYGNLMPVYLDIKAPLEPGKTKITTAQIKNFLEAVSENEDYDIYNYGTDNVDKVLDMITSRDAFAVIQDINSTAIGNFVEAIKLWNEVNGTAFDSIVTPTETIIFEPEQVKSATYSDVLSGKTDNIGTFDRGQKDIRYSRGEGYDPYAEYNYYENRKVYGENLLDALERTVQAQEDKAIIDEYRNIEADVNRKRSELSQINNSINSLLFTPADQAEAARLSGMREDVTTLKKEIRELERDVRKARSDVTVTKQKTSPQTFNVSERMFR